MVRRLTQILLLLAFMACNKPDRKYYDTGELKMERFSIGDGKEKIVKFYENGNIKECSFWNNGKRDSVTSLFYSNGLIFSEINYMDGIRHGDVTEYYESGEILRKGIFKNDSLNGPFTMFFKDGSIQRKGEYFSSGLTFREYYKTGQHMKYYHEFYQKNDTVIYFKEYNKHGLIEKFALPVQVIQTGTEYCISLLHSFIPPDKILLEFYPSRSKEWSNVKINEKKFIVNSNQICIDENDLDGVLEGYIVEKVMSNDSPMAYLKIRLDSTQKIFH